MNLTKVFLGLFICSLFFQSESKALSVTRDIYGNYIYSLMNGERVTNQRVMPNDTIECGYVGPQPPPAPLPPGPPPPPPPAPAPCNAGVLSAEISSVNSDIDRVQNAKCPRNSFTVRRCGDWLEDHAYGDVVAGFRSKARNIKAAAESLCAGPNSCNRGEVHSVVNRAQDLLNRTKSVDVKIHLGNGVYETRTTELNDGQRPIRCW